MSAALTAVEAASFRAAVTSGDRGQPGEEDHPVGSRVMVAAGETVFRGMTGTVVATDTVGRARLRRVQLDRGGLPVWFGACELDAERRDRE